jgi:glycosyltransferase involved in cell wall biosynthesis
MDTQEIYIVGMRFPHHSGHSGYEGFYPYVGTCLNSPVNFRWLKGGWGWAIDKNLASFTRPHYALGILLTEGAAALHMLRHKKALYHLIYGEVDLWLLGRLPKMAKRRLVVTFHEPTPPPWLGLDKMAPNIDAVFLVSKSQFPHFNRFIPAERIFVIPLGIDTAFFQPSEAVAQERICLTVGVHMRDYETLKSAIDLVIRADPRVRFTAVGSRLPGRNNSSLNDPRVSFLDNLSDEELRCAYQTSSLAVFPFINATANCALLEAMGCGLPIVATDVGGVREYLGDEAGILCKPHDPQALASAMLQILSDSRLARNLSQASRQRALRYDYSVVAAQMREMYSHLLQAGSP